MANNFYNPFNELFEYDRYLHARTLRTSFLGKIEDSLAVFSGYFGWMMEENEEEERDRQAYHIGIFDYFTLGIPYFIDRVTAWCGRMMESDSEVITLIVIPFFILFVVVSLALNIVRYISSLVLVIAFSPIILLVHGISKLFSSPLKHSVDSVKLKNSTTTLGEERQKRSFSFGDDNIDAKIIDSIKHITIKNTKQRWAKDLAVIEVTETEKTTVFEAGYKLGLFSESSMNRLPILKMKEALHKAAEEKRIDDVVTLLGNKEIVTLFPSFVETLLEKAVEGGCEPVIHAIFAHDEMKQKIQRYEWNLTALLTKARDHHRNIVGILLAYFPDKSHLFITDLIHCIRYNPSDAVRCLRFAMDISEVKAHLHDNANALLKLAIEKNNTEIIDMLMNVPAVRAEAERHNYYRQEQKEVSLRNIAEYKESSMSALTENENDKLMMILHKYQESYFTLMAGIDTVIENLKFTLKSRYDENKASITCDGKKISLPFSWMDFQKLTLSSTDREAALKAYYQHPDHAAYRLLSKPNSWADKNARNVYRDSHGNVWAIFEDHLPLIAMLYAKVAEEKDDSQLTIFIQTLNDIARSHNWDQTRKNAKGKEEEYNDLKADNPSCPQGMRRRLLQALPNGMLLTKEIIDEELREFAVKFIQSNIAENNYNEVKDQYDSYCITLELKEALSKATVLPTENITICIQYLTQKYGAQFDLALKGYVYRRLTENMMVLCSAECLKAIFDKPITSQRLALST